MKQIIGLLILLLFFSTAEGKHLKSYAIFDSKGKQVDFQKLVKGTESKKYIFFGEYHNNPICHWLQFELTKELYNIHKKNLLLGAEMFEADNQYIIDEYLNDQISEKSFQDEVRLWSNYNTDYKPLLEFCKANQLRMIATNIPRRYASMVYKKGIESLNEISDLGKSYMVPLKEFQFDSTVACYNALMAPGMHGAGLTMAMAQAIKDATMSYFILKSMKPNNVFLHFNGAYHSDNHEGIVYYLNKNVEMAEIMTISTVMQNDVEKLDEKNAGIADFIICVSETMTTTH